MTNRCIATILHALAATLFLSATAIAQMPDPTEPTLYEPQVDVRNGGVIEESYTYHKLGRERDSLRPGPYPPPGGWYGYGFPVTTYRWGWFGAERYYPRVTWHRSYDGDCMRWGYRCGY